MSQSNGRDQPNGGAQPARPRMDAYDPRVAPQPAPNSGYPQQPQYAPQQPQYAQPAPPPASQQGYARPQAAAPQPAPAQPAPYYPDPNAGYAYPTPAAPQRQPATQPMSAYQYLPQGYGPGGQQPQPPQAAPQQPQSQPGPALQDPRLSSLGDTNRTYRPDPRGEPRFDAGPDPRARQAPPQQPGYQPPSRAAAFDPGRNPTLPPTQPPQLQVPSQSYDPRYQQAAYAQQPVPSQAARPQPPPAAAPALRGGHFDHHAPNDPRGFDLNAYMPGAQPVQGVGAGGPQGYAQPAARNPQDQWRPDATFDRGQPDRGPNAMAGNQQSYPDEAEHEAEDQLPDEPPASRGRGLLMIGLLCVAIGTGGGLAYAYKTFFAAPKSGQAPKVVKAPQQPVKTAPTDPGGKKIANADSKLLDRVGSETLTSDEPGVIRTKTIAINPNGTIAVPSTQPVEPRAPSSAPVPSMPGIILRDSAAQPPPPPAPAAIVQPVPPRGVQITNGGAGQPPAPPLPQTAPPLKQRTAAVVAPPPAPAPAADAAPPAPPAAKAQPKKVVAKPGAQDAYAPGGAPAAVGAPKAGANGYLAALSSSTSEASALQSLADLQQSYGTVLGDKLMNVVRADIPGKGVFYRVVVGPAASKQAANKVCADVTAAGHSKGECWPVPAEDPAQ